VLAHLDELVIKPIVRGIELSEDVINFEHLLNECFALVKPLAESKNVQLEYHLQDLCLLRNDHVRLKQILINLLSNAIKYNRTGGSVLLQCVATEASLIRIEILDTGNGIEKEHLPYIFTPFERLGADSRHIEGTGIGLMITRRLVKLMKGEIGVISRSGAGSIFWIDLPIHLQQESSILARGDHYSSLFNTTPIFGFGPHDCRAFKLLEDLCSIRTTILFRHDSRTEVLTDWLTQQRTGHVVICGSTLASLENHPAVQMLLKKFTVTVVNDESTPATATTVTATGNRLSGSDCRYADLPMVRLASPETCKVIKQCN
ncbi:MAG: ATP-binding protein, partial [Pseudomonadota bacterium]